MNRIERKFSELKRQNKKAFITFLTAGYPNLNTTKRLVLEFARVGVDIVEIGIPFSDPLADGPIIQEASQSALKRKINIDDILRLVKALRKTTEIPICLMSYYNPIFCYGQQSFIKKASTFGVDGVIIPDFPPEEAHSFIGLANKFNLDTIFFLSPTSPIERIRLVSRISKGFIYYVSLIGVTGPRQKLALDLVSNISLIKRNTPKPVCVGFGVSHPEHVKEICKIADGVIVGSAIIKKIKENIGKTDLVKRVGHFVYSLKR